MGEMKEIVGYDADGYIPTYVSTCEKDTYNNKKLNPSTWGNKKSMKDLLTNRSTRHPDNFGEIKIEHIRNFLEKQDPQTIMFSKPSTHAFYLTDFLLTVAPNISEDLISTQNLTEIQNLAQQLKGGITNFFGFESRLTSTKARADYLIAVSSRKGEREALLNAINNENLPEEFYNKKEWQQLRELTEKWADPDSILHRNILGLWLEFDTANEDIETPVPNIFLQTMPLRIDSPEDIEKCIWVTRDAIPTLTGSRVSEKLENKFINALEKLPKGASVFHVASMLARGAEGMRLVIKRIKPEDIVPYLESIGWKDNKEKELTALLNDIKNFSNCIRLHININDQVDPKIGLECFISPDKYHEGEGWNEFFNYLISKNLCFPQLGSALLSFPGVVQEDTTKEFTFDSYMPSVKIEGDDFSKALVRYISHVKISYNPNKSVEAKAYTGVRLFGTQ